MSDKERKMEEENTDPKKRKMEIEEFQTDQKQVYTLN